MEPFEQIDRAFMAAHGPPVSAPFGTGPADDLDSDYLDGLIQMIDTAIRPGSVQATAPRRSARGRIAGMFFYAILIAAVILAFFVNGSGGGAPRDVFGFSAMTVLTKSMQSEIPQDSLVITRRVPPGTIRIGDDITCLRKNSITVTHRVVGIYENYEGSGERAFETKGIENDNPDKDIVYAENVIGKVIFHSYIIGRAMVLIKENLVYAIIIGVLLVGFVIALQFYFSGRRNEARAKRKPGLGKA